MVEFSPAENATYKQSFAGDVYNTAVYLKRLCADTTNVAMLSAVGCDPLSDLMINDFTEKGIDCLFMRRVIDKQPGAYLIKLSEVGERSFVYWRDTSAAKQVISQLEAQMKNRLQGYCDIFYFSGISLAIIDKQDRADFWQLLVELKQSGAKIVFDSNFRARLWQNKADAIEQFDQALRVSDVVFAGVEDFEELYSLTTFETIDEYLLDFTIAELIIKNGADGLFYRSRDEQYYMDVPKVDTVVDSTSAGDSFNSGYLSVRMHGGTSKAALEKACQVSACVIQHKGAIVDEKVFIREMIKSHQ